MTTPDAAASLRTSRYGERGDPRRLLRRAAVVVGVVGLAVAVWVAWGMLEPKARSSDVGFEIVSPDQATITFDVMKPADRSAVCRVQALNTGFGEVGVRDVTVGPAEQDAVRVSATLNTSEEATTVVVDGCELQ